MKAAYSKNHMEKNASCKTRSSVILCSVIHAVTTGLKTVNMYVGESKIIRTIGTCFAVGYTAGWA
jgi:hypothetical protein